MSTPRPTVYVLAEIGLPGLERFRRQLRTRLAPSVGQTVRVSLLRPPDERALERLRQRVLVEMRSRWESGGEQVWARGIPEYYLTTPAESAFYGEIGGARPSSVAMVVLLTPGLLKDQRTDSLVEHMVRYCIRGGRGDLVAPVLLAGPAPRASSPKRTVRLLAATECLDWRRVGLAEGAQIEALSDRLSAALATPVAAREAAPKVEGPRVVRVDINGGGDCYRLAEGIALVRDGGRVEVMPGTYPETATVRKSVHMVGVGDRQEIRVVGGLSTPHFQQLRRSREKDPSRIRAVLANLTIEHHSRADDAYSAAVWINAGQLTIRGCTIVATGGRAVSDLNNANGAVQRGPVRIEDCSLRSAGVAVEFASSAPFIVRRCLFEGTGTPGQTGLGTIYAGAGTVTRCAFAGLERAIIANSTGEVAVSDCRIDEGQVGLSASCRTHLSIRRSRIVGVDWGLLADAEAVVEVVDCRLSGSRGAGIRAGGSARVTAWDNDIRDCPGSGVNAANNSSILVVATRVRGSLCGVSVGDSASAEVIACDVRDSHSFGIGAAGSAVLAVRANSVINNNQGIQFTDQASGEVDANVLAANRSCGVGLWTTGHVEVRGNDLTGNPTRPLFVAEALPNIVVKGNAGVADA